MLFLALIGGVMPSITWAQECDPAWQALGSGVDGGVVNAVATTKNGEIFAGGNFTKAGGGAALKIARWTPLMGWTPMGSGLSMNNSWDSVAAIIVDRSGDVLVGGTFTTIGGIKAGSIARWTTAGGTGMWLPIADAVNGTVNSLLVHPDGRLIAGGSFYLPASPEIKTLAAWDGSAWGLVGGEIGGDPGGSVFALEMLPSGSLIAGGHFFSAGGVPANHIARWDGVEWSALGQGVDNGTFFAGVMCLDLSPDGTLVAGGNFASAGGLAVNHVARWNEASGEWSALGSGVAGGNFTTVHGVVVQANGDIYIGGDFAFAGGVPTQAVARWDGEKWTNLGTGPGLQPVVYAVAPLQDHSVVVGGFFQSAGSLPSKSIAVWGCPMATCTVDCDASGSLTIDDFVCFQTFFVLGDAKADCDASGSLTIDDFICFQTSFVLGC